MCEPLLSLSLSHPFSLFLPLSVSAQKCNKSQHVALKMRTCSESLKFSLHIFAALFFSHPLQAVGLIQQLVRPLSCTFRHQYCQQAGIFNFAGNCYLNLARVWLPLENFICNCRKYLPGVANGTELKTNNNLKLIDMYNGRLKHFTALYCKTANSNISITNLKSRIDSHGMQILLINKGKTTYDDQASVVSTEKQIQNRPKVKFHIQILLKI